MLETSARLLRMLSLNRSLAIRASLFSTARVVGGNKAVPITNNVVVAGLIARDPGGPFLVLSMG
jgi:hypothetical protein